MQNITQQLHIKHCDYERTWLCEISMVSCLFAFIRLGLIMYPTNWRYLILLLLVLQHYDHTAVDPFFREVQ